MRQFLAAVLFFVSLVGPVGAAQRFALLVGVSNYPDAPGISGLAGPVNDVELMQDTLSEVWGPSADIRRLSDGKNDGYDDPTRTAILGALATLADDARAGDEVLVFLAGHGTQIPVPGGEATKDEPDGKDEIFLPSDFYLRNDGSEITIENQIVDNEFGVAFQAIMDKGATLWLVADLCHAGTLERGEKGSIRTRSVLLGLRPGMVLNNLNPPLPTQGINTSDAPAIFDVPGGATAGRFIGFFAAGPGDLSVEMPMPTGADGQMKVHGVFTYQLARALRSRQSTTFADLAEQIKRAFWQWGQGLPIPVFSGALRQEINIGAAGDSAIVLAADEDGIFARAGILDGIEQGQILALSDPAAAQRGVVAYARVVAADLAQSRLQIIRDDPDLADQIDAMIRAEGLDPEMWRTRWLSDRINGFVGKIHGAMPTRRLKIAMPLGADPALSTKISRALSSIKAPLALVAVPAGQPAGLRLEIRGERLIFRAGLARKMADQGSNYSLDINGLDAETIAKALGQIAKAQFLLRLAPTLAQAPIAQQLKTSVLVQPCDTVKSSDAIPVSPLMSRLLVRDCDTVTLQISNLGAYAVDLSPFYLGPQGRIYYLRGYPDGDFFGLRILAGETQSVTYKERLGEADATGDMFLLLLAVRADLNTDYPADFRYLEGELPDTGPLRQATVAKTNTTGAVLIPLRTVENSP